MDEDLALVLLSSAMFFALKLQSLIHNVYIIYNYTYTCMYT